MSKQTWSFKLHKEQALETRKAQLEIIRNCKTRKEIGEKFIISEDQIIMKSRKEYRCSYRLCRKIIPKGSIYFRNVFFPVGTSIGCCPNHMKEGSTW